MAEDGPFLAKALALLREGPDPGAARWLSSRSRQGRKVSQAASEDGGIVLIVDGISQDSRRQPEKDALALLSGLPGRMGRAFLYGLGSPALCKALLERTNELFALEPSPEVARAFFSSVDLSGPLADGSLRLFTPWGLQKPLGLPSRPELVAHRGTLRRDPWMYEALKARLAECGRGPKGRPGPSGPGILIVPPLSGGPASMGGFLEKAALGLGLRARLLSWPAALPLREAALRGAGGPPEGLTGLFRDCLGFLAKEAAAFSPGLVLALAQAPLDPPGVARLRDMLPDAILAFWFVEDMSVFRYAEGLVPLYDLFLHIQGDFLAPRLCDLGALGAHYLPPCADPGFFRPREVPERFRARLSFMGAGYPNRLGIFGELASRWGGSGRPASDFKVFGSGWQGASPELAGHLFEGGRRLTPEETALVYAGRGVQLNIHSGRGEGYNPGSWFVNPRTFEIAAAGGFQIVDRRPLLQGLFGEGELAVSDSPEGLPALIERFLGDPGEAGARGAKARQRVLEAHTYEHRLETILSLAFPKR
ncbi:MAG: glycosyltransferase [Deltaproteobacteria bacterium]|jgi:spore maturation protein CgeB|nr:glycosyltransferase [Deltaproteobacteria bacterium]